MVEQVCSFVSFDHILIRRLPGSHIFGTLSSNDNEENPEPSTIDKICAKRAARIAPQSEHNNEQGPTSL